MLFSQKRGYLNRGRGGGGAAVHLCPKGGGGQSGVLGSSRAQKTPTQHRSCGIQATQRSIGGQGMAIL